MLRGLYTAAAGMMAQQRKHDAATNNIANLNTPGFKSAGTAMRSFPEMLISIVRDGTSSSGGQGGAGASNRIGSLHAGVFAEENFPLFLQGDVMHTGNPTDLAILSNIQVDGLTFDSAGRAVNEQGEIVFQPQAFFTAAGQDGVELYTRDGKFLVNDAGQWVTASGYRVLGADGQPIQTDLPPEQIRITADGSLLEAATGLPVTDPAGEPIRLRISVINNPYDLVRYGNSMFQLSEGAQPAELLAPGQQAEVRQGYIERSNVDPAQATVDMMTALRMYEMNQRVIQFYDRTLEKAVTEIGRV